MSLASRSYQAELMDGEDVSPQEFSDILRDLARANSWTLGRRPTLRWLARVVEREDFSLLDVGFGQGDMLRAIAERWPRARLTGIDLNPKSAPVAAALTPGHMNIEYVTGDLYAAGVERPDYVVSALVTHHMADNEVARFIRWMEASAVKGWFINDLHRHWLARDGFSALAWALRWHPVVRHDGRLSVTRAFRRDEWRRLLREAQVPQNAARIGWYMPFRLCVERCR